MGLCPHRLESSEQAQGASALRKDAKDAIHGRLSAGQPWPAMLCYGHWLPSLYVGESSVVSNLWFGSRLR